MLSIATLNHSTSETRRTRIWFVQNNEQPILEARHPENPWVPDIEKQPRVHIEGKSTNGLYQLHMGRDSSNHDKVRSLMRKKYGWRDIWVGVLFDTSKSALIVAKPIN